MPLTYDLSRIKIQSLIEKIKEVTGVENGHSFGVNIQVEEYRPAIARNNAGKMKSPMAP